MIIKHIAVADKIIAIKR